jgi:hypothetical protein
MKWQAATHQLPEAGQLFHPLFRWIAGDDRGVDRADRDAGHPVDLDLQFRQRLNDAGLERAQRAAALQHQRDLVRQRHAGGSRAGTPRARSGDHVHVAVQYSISMKSSSMVDVRVIEHLLLQQLFP